MSSETAVKTIRPKIRVIPAKTETELIEEGIISAKKRVAAYARVSTENEEQQSSYKTQMEYYTGFIKNNPEWEFAGIYADEGITGTNRKNRDGFNSMMKDALSGKIDIILTKSISRFARNTVDLLSAVRELKANGVEVHFEKENINTMDSKGEIFITVLSSLAQEESRSISENIIWAKQKSMAEGKVYVPFKYFLGYDRGPDGNLVVNEEEAKIVREIYDLFLKGNNPTNIANILTARNVPTPAKKSNKWYPGTVRSILTNEKYKGDALLQKTFVKDFLTKEVKVNTGELPQYYVKGNHEAIIDPAVYDKVQIELKNRNGKTIINGEYSPFSCKVFCGICGEKYIVIMAHNKRGKIYRGWGCKKRKGGHMSETHGRNLWHDSSERIFIKALEKFLRNKDGYIPDIRKKLDGLQDISSIENALKEKSEALSSINSEIGELSEAECPPAKVQELDQSYAALEKEVEDLKAAITAEKVKKTYIEDTLSFLENEEVVSKSLNDILENNSPKFPEDLWWKLADKMLVYERGVEVVFNCDITIFVSFEDVDY